MAEQHAQCPASKRALRRAVARLLMPEDDIAAIAVRSARMGRCPRSVVAAA